jgi:hypothetical protein
VSPLKSPVSSSVTTPIIVASTFAGLAFGAVTGPPQPLPAVIIGVLAVQTLLTVGALPRGWYRDRAVQQDGRSFVWLHHATSTIPLLVMAALIGWGSDLGVGLIALAIVPIAAGAPVYAAAAGVEPSRIAACTVHIYTLSLVVTPLLAFVTLGRATGFMQVAVTLLLGLIVPTAMALALHDAVERIPVLARFLTVGAGLFVISFCYGGTMGAAMRGAAGSGVLLLVGLLIGVLRGPVGATLAVVARRARQQPHADAAAIAGGYKNVTLSAGIGLAAAGPVAAAPSIGGLLGEAITLTVIARLCAKRTSVLRPAPPALETGSLT